MNSGRSLINSHTECFLCGNNGGLKVKCSQENCAYIVDGKRTEAVFHVTCARMAGLEVNATEDGSKLNFFGEHCIAVALLLMRFCSLTQIFVVFETAK